MPEHTWAADDGHQRLYQSESSARIEIPADNPARWRWWLWPHLLSLDAPLVAVTWQAWWAVTTHARVSWAYSFILGFAVWMIYLADRLADVERAVPGELPTDRHACYARHRVWMRWLLAIVSTSLVIATPILLPLRQFAGGLVMLGVTGIYYWMIHYARLASPPRLPKEAVVGTLFSIGSGFFTAFAPLRLTGEIWTGLTLFSGLCFLNCGLISAWEQSPQDREDAGSMLNAFPRLTAALGTGAMSLAAVSLLLGTFYRSSGLMPVALSAAALWMLDRCRYQFSARALRVLADVVLLTPLLFLGWRLALR